MNTIKLAHNDAILTKAELKKFKKGDLIWGDDQNPKTLKTWSIEDEDDALEELKRHRCSYDGNRIEEWALEYCETNEDGEFVEGSDFKFAKEANLLLKNEWFSDEFDNLEKAKHYYGSDEPAEKDEYLYEDYDSYVDDFKDYIEDIWDCDSLEELADVLNSRSDYSNGSFKVEK